MNNSSLAGEHGLPFDYASFTRWYKEMSTKRWSPAEATIRRLLNEHLDRELTPGARRRVKVADSRIKDTARTWKKLLLPKYSSKITSLDDIPAVIDDIVGVRITCDNLSDIQGLVDSLEVLPAQVESNINTHIAPLSIEEDRHKNYVDNPKPTGYRAYHVNLATTVSGPKEFHVVRVEVQIRTRLQDSWGELTHEDTYKPGMELPEIIEPLARRMADLLAVVDSIAQDIRNELDRQIEVVSLSDIGGPPAVAHTEYPRQDRANHSSDQTLEQGISGDIVRIELSRIVEALTRPMTLAELAQELIGLFGPEIANGWDGAGTFKALLQSAVPDAAIIAVPPGYVAPSGLPIPEEFSKPADRNADEGQTPEVILQLRQTDSRIPTFSGQKLGQLLVSLEVALEPESWEEHSLSNEPSDMRKINIVSRIARDQAFENNQYIPRNQLDWALKALLWKDNFRPGVSANEIASTLTNWIVRRAASQAVPFDDASALEEAIYEWFINGIAEFEDSVREEQ